MCVWGGGGREERIQKWECGLSRGDSPGRGGGIGAGTGPWIEALKVGPFLIQVKV